MRIVEHAAGHTGADSDGPVEGDCLIAGDWADRTRRVLTRDLLLRAHLAPPTEGHALQFRALHLNLPLVGDVADGLGLSRADRTAVEHDALDGLVQALRAFDACGDAEFADFAVPFVEREIARSLRHLAGRI